MLTGYKTYITAALMILLAAAKMFGIDLGIVYDPGTLLMSGVGLIFARAGAAADAGKS